MATLRLTAYIPVMARYFFHVSDSNGFVEDEESRDLSGVEDARTVATREARALMADDLRSGALDLSCFIEVEDEKRSLLFTLHFRDAITVIDQSA